MLLDLLVDVPAPRLVRAKAEPRRDKDRVPDILAAEEPQLDVDEIVGMLDLLSGRRLERDLRRRAAHVEKAVRRARLAIARRGVLVLVEAVHEVVDGDPPVQALLFARDDANLVGAVGEVEGEGAEVRARRGEDRLALVFREEAHARRREKVDGRRRELVSRYDGRGVLDERAEVLCDALWSWAE